ncbi:MAG: AMP-dependent synthetase [Desulfuromonas sp.]|nr:MAG: AMP-dependent synthetase [Desulfuromonas sp.]
MQTINQFIASSCQRHSGRIALQHKKHGRWHDLSYKDLWARVETIAAGLRSQDLKTGDHAALLGPSSPQWVMAYLGVLRAGGVVVPIDKELKSAELKHVLTDSDMTHILVSKDQLDTLLEILSDLPKLKKVILLDADPLEAEEEGQAVDVLDKLAEAWRSLSATVDIPEEQKTRIESLAIQAQKLLSRQPEQEPTGKKRRKTHFLAPEEALRKQLMRSKKLLTLEQLHADEHLPPATHKPTDCAVILYTSGTTGRSKGAMLSHHNIVSNILGACRHFNLDKSMSTLSFLPINHVFEQVCGILLPLSLGGQVSFAESIKKLGDNLNEVRPSFMLGVPAVYRLLYDRIVKNIEAKPLSRVLFKLPVGRKLVTNKVQQALGKDTIFVSGGAALDPAVAEGFRNLGLILYQGYGITETSPVLSAESPFKQKPGTVGLPLDEVQIMIDQPNSEGIGEILAKGPNIMLGYYNNKQATKDVLADGWYHTGDLGRIDEEGVLSICGRVKNLIVTPNGKNVYPEEVENALLSSPYIAEVMIYGHKISATAEEVYAAIYPNEEKMFEYEQERGKGPLTPGDVEEVIRKEVLAIGRQLADYKRIKKFTIREDEFPKTTTRKIKRYIVEPQISTATD